MKFLRSFQKSLPLFIFGFLLHLLFKPAFSHAADWDEIIAYLQDASTLILEINSNVDGTYNFLPSPSVNKSFASNENGALRILSVQNNNAGFLFNSDIYIYFKDIAFSGFTNAVSMKNNGVISFEGFSQFEANALGLSLDNSSANFINSTVTFNSNSSPVGANGGAIYAANSSFLNFLYSSATFSNNTASQNGGAVYLEKSTLAFSYSNANFFKNSANVNGGAISIFQSTLSILNSNLAFSTNSAAALGG
ncbi:MAG: hypothetical protein LBC07_00430, partial [Elusimicrobiota bacterium]|nr:hypothetical protein [Elusimicrobiota bacterium]